MNEILILYIIENMLPIATTVLVGFVMAWLRKQIGVENMKKIQEELYAKKELAELAVKFTQQAYKDLNGEEKLQEASIWLHDRAKAKGIKLDQEEIEGLIEATLKDAKSQFGQEWKKSVNSK